MTELRWDLAERPEAQTTLFAPALRTVGRGEYRGLEFLEVDAKTIINKVPGGPRFGFEYTINSYRGCSHACTYCLAGHTPVLMGDGRTKPIAKIEPGDFVYGTRQVGRYRRYTVTEVLDHWQTVKPAYRIALADGTELVASGDHRFLTDRGWKHVVGREQGAGRRPHLTMNNRLIGFGAFPDPPLHDREYQRGYLCGIIRGDGHLGTYTYERRGRDARVFRFRLALADVEPLDRTEVFLGTFGVATTRFVFAPATAERRRMVAIRTSRKSHIETIERLIAVPAEPTPQWRKGFLAGIFDAEGSLAGSLRISNSDPELLSLIDECFLRFGFRPARDARRRVQAVRVLGGLSEIVRLLVLIDPATSRKRSIESIAVKASLPLDVVMVEPLGLSMPMFDITTATGDFVADGVISHNCFARPTHEYLGLNRADDFDRRIVVKRNAVELARAETSPTRWGRDLIAMGTNTDPYQPAEGKYRLTRGILEVMAERRNPVSILTKSPLVLRDLDVLADAARHSRVRVDFSVATVDETVWKATEPGTPHPLRRLEAMARLNETGIPSGVLMGPILPGLSDGRAQLREVIARAVAGGAVSIGHVVLHLGKGVREHYLDWLEERRPDLMAGYRRMYRGRDADRSVREQIAAVVKELIVECGGRLPGSFRSAAPAAPTDSPAEVRQLGFGW